MDKIQDIYYLKRTLDGQIVAKFEVKEATQYHIEGHCYAAMSCRIDGNVSEYTCVADVSCKFDSCSHWWFSGENNDSDS